MSVAATKIQRPRLRAGLTMPRPALEQRLVQALGEQPLVLLCAPGGCGKTALLARALEQLPAGHGAAWVTLDAGDDLHRLLQCLWQALEPFDLPWRTSPEGLAAMATSRDPGRQRQAAEALVNALEACELAHGVIALDDLHHVDDAEALAFLDHLLLRLGERWTLAVATRQEPALRLARLRAMGLLTELRAADLQFSRDEALALLLPAGLDAGAAEALHCRTLGWPAGLRLALGGARGAGPGSAIDRQAIDFLTSEVLAQLDPALREFLLRTSVLHELDAGRCEALTGDARAWVHLDALERLDLFVTVVGDQPRTLKLHDLFRDALRQQMQTGRRDEWLALQARAAANEGDPVRQQALLLGARRLDEAAASLRQRSLRLMFEGGVHTVVRLAEQFPPDFARTSADVQDVAGYAKWRLWRNAEADQHLQAAEALHRARGDEASARLAALRRATMLAGIGRPDAARLALPAGDADADGAEAQVHARVCATWIALEEGASRAVAPRFEALLRTLEQARQNELWATMVPTPRLTACPAMGPLLARWADAASLAEAESPLLLSALAPMTQGWRALWAGRLDEALRWLRRSERDERWVGYPPIVQSHRLAFTAVLQMALGQREPALAAARAHGDGFPPSYGGRGPWYALFLMGRVAASCGDTALLRDALARLAQVQAGLPEATPLRLQALLGLQGHLAWLEGRPGEAVARWQRTLEHEEACDLFGLAHELRTLLALQRLRARDPAAAAAWLAPMLQQAADGPRGALFALPALRELAAAPWGTRLDTAALATLRAWGLPAGADAAAGSAPAIAAGIAPGPLHELLSARETEVLSLMARGLSNKLIARELDLSPHTVKRHVAHVLDKLDLASRSQAAAWYHAQPQARRSAPA
ncbi:MAG: AAA family ATPase [Burkholderiaceae bacterium]|nr:AAA family ATPase [Burkholderiaceae bacterium]